MLERLDGRFLHTFLTVVEAGSFSKAAEKLALVQSTVTTQVRQLEELAGAPLFHRLPRGVALTAAGEKLAGYARRFEQLALELEQALAADDEPAGRVRLRMLESFSAERIADLLQGYMERYPQVEVYLETGFFQDTVEAVVGGACELGIVPDNPGRSDLAYTPLADDHLVWVASRKAADAYRQGGWASLQQVRLIGFGSRCLYQRLAERHMHKQQVGPVCQLEFASVEMIKQAVRSGLGIALLPFMNVQRELEAELLHELPGGDAHPIRHGVIHLKHSDLSSAAMKLKERLISVWRKSPESVGMSEDMVE